MHPAKSVITLTVATGAGYGLAFFLAMFMVLGLIPLGALFSQIALTFALGLIVAGLVASTLHLGHPERSWRAMSQWRSSWLSREGLLAVFTFAPLGLWWLSWFTGHEGHSAMTVIRLLAMVGCLLTVFATSMIYGSLKTIKAWANGWTPAVYLVLAGMTGTLLLYVIMTAGRLDQALYAGLLALGFMLAGAGLKFTYWVFVESTPSLSTPESATGLGQFGKVTLVEAPHSQANYLLREMGFQVARKHSQKLRKLVYLLGFAVPFVAVGLSLLPNFSGPVALGLAIFSALSAGLGIIIERWLYFAEAKHTVMLYYGASSA